MPRGIPNPPLSLELIEQHTERSPDGCLLWTGPLRNAGYAHWKFDGQWVAVHRWLYQHAHGELDSGLTVDHQCHDPAECVSTQADPCDHRRCLEITHLLAMSNAENSMRGGSPLALKSRQSECKQGHPLEGANLYTTPDGRRQCKRCRADAWLRWRDRHADDTT